MENTEFIYIQIQDGGADHFYISWDKETLVTYDRAELTNGVASEISNFTMIGWMSKDCRVDDMNLVRFLKTADVGDVHFHRLGYCIRINTESNEENDE